MSFSRFYLTFVMARRERNSGCTSLKGPFIAVQRVVADVRNGMIDQSQLNCIHVSYVNVFLWSGMCYVCVIVFYVSYLIVSR
jgi:hypothetical protein